MSWVDWADEALDELADIWVLATPEDRPRIEARVADVNRELERDPLTFGEERYASVRVDVHPVLTVWFRFLEDGRVVRVIHVHRPGRRSRS
jgi:plasmid stabilization system protein ParE